MSTDLIKETESIKMYRIYKKLVMNPKSKKIVKVWYVNVTFFKEKNTLVINHCYSWPKSNIYKTRKSISINLNHGARSFKRRYENTEELYSFVNKLSKYTQRRLNRILKEYLPKTKITYPTAYNITITNSPNAQNIFKKEHLVNNLLPINKHIKKAKGWKDLIRRCCGYSGKKTVRLISSSDRPDILLSNLSICKGLFTHGEINNLLEKWEKPVSIPKSDLYKINKNLAANYKFSDIYWIDDIKRLINELKYHNYDWKSEITDSFEKTHANLSFAASRLKTKNIDFPKYEFDGARIGEFTIRICPDLHTLQYWGKYMSNCVAGYRDSILSKRIIMCGIFNGDKLIYNMSLRKDKKYHISEIKKRFNECLTDDELSPIQDFVDELQ